MQIYKTIAVVAGELAQAGIQKLQKNKDQNYAYRGIDDVYNAAGEVFAKHGLVIMPRCTERVMTERTSRQGTSLFSVVVRVEYDFLCAEDGSCHTAVVYGEAIDTSDKATNKAMSAAYKVAVLQTFCIPTEGDNDADADTHEVVPKKEPEQIPQTQQATKQTPNNPAPQGASKAQMIHTTITEVGVKRGTSARGAWTKYNVVTEQGVFGTFNESLGKKAEKFAKKGMVEITYLESDKGKNLVGVESWDEGIPVDTEIDDVPF